MKKRFIYMLLFLVPGLFVSLLITVAVFGAAFGVLWLWVYGDTSWPPWIEKVTPALMIAVFVSLWVIAMVAGYVVGKKREAALGFDVRHVWFSLGATLLPIGIAVLHQFSIGTLGPKSDQQRCSEYCGDLGYRSSGITPQRSEEKNCTCFAQYGEEQINVPIAELPP